MDLLCQASRYGHIQHPHQLSCPGKYKSAHMIYMSSAAGINCQQHSDCAQVMLDAGSAIALSFMSCNDTSMQYSKPTSKWLDCRHVECILRSILAGCRPIQSHAWLQAGRLERVFELYNQMQSWGLQLSSRTFTGLMTACATAKHLAAAEGILRLMEKVGQVPAVQTYTALINACVNQGSPAALQRAFQVCFFPCLCSAARAMAPWQISTQKCISNGLQCQSLPGGS